MVGLCVVCVCVCVCVSVCVCVMKWNFLFAMCTLMDGYMNRMVTQEQVDACSNPYLAFV